MKQATSEHTTTRQSERTTQQDTSAGPNGISIAPPTYGIDFVDRGLADAAHIQRRAEASKGTSEALGTGIGVSEPPEARRARRPNPLAQVTAVAGATGHEAAHAAVLQRITGGRLSRATPAILQLQRQYGNRSVQLARQIGNETQATPSGQLVIQPILTIGPADDKYEREADAVARQVMRQISQPNSQPAVQRETDDDETLQRQDEAGGANATITQFVQRQSTAAGGSVDPVVEAAINRSRGGGRPLPDNTRAAMEGGFGADFSGVRVHTDAQADTLNHSLSARAFTTGQDIFFRQGEYNPGSTAGKEVLAHELTHVVQQTGGVARMMPLPSQGATPPANRSLEREAGASGKRVGGSPSLQSEELAERGAWSLAPGSNLGGRSVQHTLQAKWIDDSDEEGRVKWDALIEGVQWYSKGGQLMYHGQRIPGLPDPGNYFDEQVARNAKLKFYKDSPLETALKMPIEQMPLGLFYWMSALARMDVVSDLETIRDKRSEIEKGWTKETPLEKIQWFASTICDLTSMMVMYDALGVAEMEAVKLGPSSEVTSEGQSGGTVQTQKVERPDTDSLLQAFDTWANINSAGVIQFKFSLYNDFHTFAIEKIYEDEKNKSFKIFQSYQGLYTLKEFMGPSEDIAAKFIRKKNQVAKVIAAAEAFGGGQVFGQKYVKDNVVQPFQECLKTPVEGSWKQMREAKKVLKAKTELIIGKGGSPSADPIISKFLVVAGQFELQQVETETTGFAGQMADQAEIESLLAAIKRQYIEMI